MLVSRAHAPQPCTTTTLSPASPARTATNVTKDTPREPGGNHHPQSKQLRSTKETNPNNSTVGEQRGTFHRGTEPCETSETISAEGPSAQAQPGLQVPLPGRWKKPRAALALLSPHSTHHTVLHAEAQLVLGVGAPDDSCGDGGAVHYVQHHLCLVLQLLESEGGCVRLRRVTWRG